jgi:tannase/feruloyl esterase
MKGVFLTALVVASAVAYANLKSELAAAPGQACESLASLKLSNTTMTVVKSIEAGRFTPPNAADEASPSGGTQAFRNVPAFCRVAATLTPSRDSEIHIEVWLPTDSWNSKFEAVGNGAWSGSIRYPEMADAVRHGYATASTDTGHAGGSASFALGHPEKLIDFAYRSEHEMTVSAKAMINAFYGRAPNHAYWFGCSAGGRQALKEAQMYPADFDGIIAGSPGLDWTARSAQAVRAAHAAQREDARLTAAKRQVLHDAALRACDAADGVKDGVIENPAKCSFEPRSLQCEGSDGPDCLTPAQVTTAQLIYTPMVDRKTKRKLVGLAPGSELGWTDLGWSASARTTGIDHYRFVVYKDPAWDVERFNVETDIARIDEADGAALNATDPNLRPFFDRGGKLLQYHGWSDPQISPLDSVEYYQRVVSTLGGAEKLHSSYRLFMAPGMAHCGGGEGPNQFDKMSVLEQWVENGKAPDSIIASHSKNGQVDRTRPLCPYPQTARYSSGSIDDAASFVCTTQ